MVLRKSLTTFYVSLYIYLRFRLNNHKHSIKHNLSGYPAAMHFNEQSHTIEDLRFIKNHLPDIDNRKLVEEKTIIKLNTYITRLNKQGIFFYRIMTFKLYALAY